MTEWSPWDWIVGSIGVASFALYLLDRAYREAIKQTREACDREHSDLQQRIDELKKRYRIRENE
jgi:hypothetical protein